MNKLYLKNGMKVHMCDSIPAREINSVFKDAIISLKNDKINFERDGKSVDSELVECGIDSDECGYFIYLGD